MSFLKHLTALGKVLLVSSLGLSATAIAGAIHVWSSGEIIQATDLNAALLHIHSLMVGGHGPRLVNADVSASAAIATSKLADGASIPKAFAVVTGGSSIGTTCTSGTCTLWNSHNVTSVTHVSTGVYQVVLAYTATDATYTVIGSGIFSNSQMCQPALQSNMTTAGFRISCTDTSNSPQDGEFSFLVVDDN